MISSGAERRTDGSQLKISGAKQSLAPVLLMRNNQLCTTPSFEALTDNCGRTNFNYKSTIKQLHKSKLFTAKHNKYGSNY